MASNICPRCTKAVYMAEEILACGHKWHKACFLCKVCNKRLDSTTATDKDGQVYCKSCYGKEFGPKGYGYGGGAGTLSMDNGRQVGGSAAGPASSGPTVDEEGRIVNVSSGANGECPRCGKAVYLAEKIIGAGSSWHKSCFMCANCRKGLDSTTVADNSGQIYCKACHGKFFGPKGFGYGQGAGALTNTQ
ncbi:zyxin-binding protein [Capsaspora owczarzaki ATCC 30864]|uniref:Zyxin-binding protein n=1 Tax=Capsaspora owczarzaki (strain ATCC 30864) TaxID=595528 RepID=A0A0D2U9P0_CAPO3|nr:zyxin-binding protein [Capsaspora owczarzaki ATCC 30864]KJE91791.1 zyxin-binding protein [Capsaspora owczarzaki ATCC 30864]|eukprot:XP_004363714.1 zyxin-binding protein [Capsaspora owczarzaki ATCC 30864]